MFEILGVGAVERMRLPFSLPFHLVLTVMDSAKLAAIMQVARTRSVMKVSCGATSASERASSLPLEYDR